jgi:iron(III) transport system substrate-binding protein
MRIAQFLRLRASQRNQPCLRLRGNLRFPTGAWPVIERRHHTKGHGPLFDRRTCLKTQESKTWRALLDQFTDDTGIEAEVIRLGTGRLYERVMTEFSGGKLEADIVVLTDWDLMQSLADEGVLVPYQARQWDRIDPQLREEGGHFYTMNRYPAVLGFNTTVWTKETAPQSWAATLDPEYKGQVGIVQAAAGGSSWSVALFQRKVVDPEFWEKQAENDPRIYTSSAPMADDIARGEITVGTVQLGLVKNLAEKGAPISLLFPEEGAPTVGAAVGVTSTAKHPNAAKLYIDYVTSKRGGTAISSISNDYPSHPEAPPPDLSEYGIEVPPATSLWTADPKESAALRDQWIAEWDTVYRRQ